MGASGAVCPGLRLICRSQRGDQGRVALGLRSAALYASQRRSRRGSGAVCSAGFRDQICRRPSCIAVLRSCGAFLAVWLAFIGFVVGCLAVFSSGRPRPVVLARLDAQLLQDGVGFRKVVLALPQLLLHALLQVVHRLQDVRQGGKLDSVGVGCRRSGLRRI